MGNIIDQLDIVEDLEYLQEDHLDKMMLLF
jgi:hypothetical protein